jgi:hypothetical protein
MNCELSDIDRRTARTAEASQNSTTTQISDPQEAETCNQNTGAL